MNSKQNVKNYLLCWQNIGIWKEEVYVNLHHFHIKKNLIENEFRNGGHRRKLLSP